MSDTDMQKCFLTSAFKARKYVNEWAGLGVCTPLQALYCISPCDFKWQNIPVYIFKKAFTVTDS